jgi:hypothetical protein
MNADSKDNTRGCHSRERGNPGFLATTESTEHTENEPAPECHCEARRAAALRAEGDAAISTTAKDINLQNKTYLTTEHGGHGSRAVEPAEVAFLLRALRGYIML